MSLTHFMALVSFYTSWNTSENQKSPDVFRGYWKWLLPWNGLRVTFNLQLLNLLLICVTEESKTEKLFTKWNCWFSSSNAYYKLTLIKLFLFFLTLLVVFLNVWSMHNLLLSCVICFWFHFGCTDCSLYIKSLFDWG